MLNSIRRLVRFCCIGNDDNEIAAYNLYLNDLFVSLFAVIIGIAATRFVDLDTYAGKLQFIVDMFAIMLSWWGYYFSTTKGPDEKNTISFAINIALLIVYWSMLNYDNDYIFTYPLIFLLYLIWETIRYLENDDDIYRTILKNSIIANIIFLSIMIAIAACKHAFEIQTTHLYITAALILVHRATIQHVYSIEKSAVDMGAVDDGHSGLLMAEARNAHHKAHAPVSKMKIGAALMTRTDEVFTGCNVEFDKFNHTIHAEESAISSMVASGMHAIRAVAVYSKSPGPTFPSGLALQTILEFGDGDTQIIVCNDNEHQVKALRELLPHAFER